MNANQRKALYALAAAVGALLAAIGIINPDYLGPILAVVAGTLTVIGSFTASKHITPDAVEGEIVSDDFDEGV